MVHFPSGGICLLRICNIPVSIPLSPLFPGAILQTGQSGLGYVNILSKTHITQRITLRIFLLVLLFNSLLLLLLQLLMIFFFFFTTICWGYLQITLHRQGSSQCAQRIWLLLSCHIRSFLLYCGVVLLVQQSAMTLLQGHFASPIPTSN